jgi:hypothetical protein
MRSSYCAAQNCFGADWRRRDAHDRVRRGSSGDRKYPCAEQIATTIPTAGASCKFAKRRRLAAYAYRIGNE